MPTLVREPSPLEALPGRFPRPGALRVGQWAAARLDAGDLGPALLELVLWYPTSEAQPAAALAAALGPVGDERTVTLNRLALAALAPALVPADALGDDVAVTGRALDGSGFENRHFFGARAVQCATGVVVAVRTGG
ncbi:MAG: hypothetical protein R3B06_01160 [Kofleriaceae bacterium]